VELARLTAGLAGVVHKTLQPERISLWLRTEERRATGEK
jgi:hypothetical protein